MAYKGEMMNCETRVQEKKEIAYLYHPTLSVPTTSKPCDQPITPRQTENAVIQKLQQCNTPFVALDILSVKLDETFMATPNLDSSYLLPKNSRSPNIAVAGPCVFPPSQCCYSGRFPPISIVRRLRGTNRHPPKIIPRPPMWLQ